MRHDPFEFSCTEMTTGEKVVRVLFLLVLISVLLFDIFFWRP